VTATKASLVLLRALNPTTLPAGMLQESVNMRLDRGVAQTRKGSQRLTDTVGTTGAPLTLDVALGVDKSATITRSGILHGHPNGHRNRPRIQLMTTKSTFVGPTDARIQRRLPHYAGGVDLIPSFQYTMAGSSGGRRRPERFSLMTAPRCATITPAGSMRRVCLPRRTTRTPTNTSPSPALTPATSGVMGCRR
jgi:hypothetical protein